jgi:hypothetical protein
MTERSRFARLISLAVLLLFATAGAPQLALAIETTAEVQVSAFRHATAMEARAPLFRLRGF